MPLIHHPVLKREMEVSAASVELWTTVPRSPWRLGPLPKRYTKPTADPDQTSPQGGEPSPSEED